MLHILLSAATLFAMKQPCADPNREVEVTRAAPPTLSGTNIAPFPGSTPLKLHVTRPVTVVLSATVSPDGSLKEAHIVRSSNDLATDQAALAAARNSTYAPKLVNCRPVMGSYIFEVKFAPNHS